MPDATAAAEPPLDPPAILSRSHGLWTEPKWESVDVPHDQTHPDSSFPG